MNAAEKILDWMSDNIFPWLVLVGLLTIAIILIIAIISVATKPIDTAPKFIEEKNIVIERLGSNLWKITDYENGIICYETSRGISCLKMDNIAEEGEIP